MNRIKPDFQKYNKSGAYHWDQISKSPRKRNSFVLGRYKNILSLLIKELNNNLSGKKILDAGCGDGALSYLITKTGSEVYGIDSSSLAIGFGKNKIKSSKANLQVGNLYEMPYVNQFFDVIIASDVIEHLDNLEQFFKEILRTLKQGGRLIISTPIRMNKQPLDPEHVCEWYPDDFEELLKTYFINSKILISHPVYLEQLTRFKFMRYIINLISLVHNPFEGFEKRNVRYYMLQYSVSINE